MVGWCWIRWRGGKERKICRDVSVAGKWEKHGFYQFSFFRVRTLFLWILSVQTKSNAIPYINVHLCKRIWNFFLSFQIKYKSPLNQLCRFKIKQIKKNIPRGDENTTPICSLSAVLSHNCSGAAAAQMPPLLWLTFKPQCERVHRGLHSIKAAEKRLLQFLPFGFAYG